MKKSPSFRSKLQECIDIFNYILVSQANHVVKPSYLLRNTTCKASYIYWLFTLLYKAGYLFRLKVSTYEIVKPIDISSIQELYIKAYGKPHRGDKKNKDHGVQTLDKIYMS